MQTLLTRLLACTADGLVICVQDDADFVHQANLLLIVPLEIPAIAGRLCGGGKHGASQGGIDVRKQRRHVLCRDRLSYCRRRTHLEE
jgi:hypothetical protein